MISFRIDKAGDHTVTMVYRPACFTLGLTVSIMSLMLFIVIIIFEKQLKTVFAAFGRNSAADLGPDYGPDDFIPEEGLKAPKVVKKEDENAGNALPEEAEDTSEEGTSENGSAENNEES